MKKINPEIERGDTIECFYTKARGLVAEEKFIQAATAAGFDYEKLFYLDKTSLERVLKHKKFQGLISQHHGKNWKQKTNELLLSYHLKFHIGIDCSEWKSAKKRMTKLLDKALNEGIICGYKYRISNVTDSDNLVENFIEAKGNLVTVKQILQEVIAAKSKKISLSDDDWNFLGKNFNLKNSQSTDLKTELKKAIRKARWMVKSERRYCHNPIAIYLPRVYSVDRIIQLCRDIEESLSAVKPARLETLSQEDVPLYPHISIRKDREPGGAYIFPTFLSETLRFHLFSSPRIAPMEMRRNALFKLLAEDAEEYRLHPPPIKNPSSCVLS